MARVRDLGLDEKVFILAGVGPLRSEKSAEYMRTNVPGIHIPDEVIERLRKTPKKDKRNEGKKICVEIIQQIRDIKGVVGIHIMAYRQENLVSKITEEAGLLPRPELSSSRN
jgi:methylenetetrahydrofolate reductase (NADPH)